MGTALRDYSLAGCGHCGTPVLLRSAPVCPFQPHGLCTACTEEITAFVAALRAHGHDPLARPRRRRRARQLSFTQDGRSLR